MGKQLTRVVIPIAILGIGIIGLLLVSFFRDSSQPIEKRTASNEIAPKTSSTPLEARSDGTRALRNEAAEAVVPEVSVLNTLDDLLRRCEAATDLDTPDELIELILSMGKLLRDSQRQRVARSHLEKRLLGESNSRVLTVMAIVLAVYDRPATDQVKILLSSAREKLGSSYGLLISLSLGPMPKDWGVETERELWKELLLYVPQAIPKYEQKYDATKPGVREDNLFGSARLRGGVGRRPQSTRDRLPRLKIADEPTLQVFFEYVGRTGDERLAYDAYGWIKMRELSAFSQLLAAYQLANENTKQSLARYIVDLPVAQPEQLAAWYSQESLDGVRRELARTLITQSRETVVQWFDALYNAEQSPQIKSGMVSNLATVATTPAVDRLMHLAGSGSIEERSWAIKALADTHKLFMTARKESFLLEYANDSSPQIRIAALEGLYNLTGSKNHEVFERYGQGDSSEAVRIVASKLSARTIK